MFAQFEEAFISMCSCLVPWWLILLLLYFHVKDLPNLFRCCVDPFIIPTSSSSWSFSSQKHLVLPCLFILIFHFTSYLCFLYCHVSPDMFSVWFHVCYSIVFSSHLPLDFPPFLLIGLAILSACPLPEFEVSSYFFVPWNLSQYQSMCEV